MMTDTDTAERKCTDRFLSGTKSPRILGLFPEGKEVLTALGGLGEAIREEALEKGEKKGRISERFDSAVKMAGVLITLGLTRDSIRDKLQSCWPDLPPETIGTALDLAYLSADHS